MTLVDSFLMQSIILFSDIKNIESGKCGENCLPGKLKATDSGKVIYTSDMGDDYLYRAEFDNSNANGYGVIMLQGLKKTDDPKKLKRVLALDLIVDSCEAI